MSRQRAFFIVTINGEPVADEFVSLVQSITINLTGEGKTTDTASVVLNDKDGQILLPGKGDSISIALGWDDEDGTVQFDGTIDKIRWSEARGAGKLLTIAAKSADVVKGKAKHKRHVHKDDATFKDAATAWGKDAGLTVVVHPDLASIQRAYWGMHGESFMHWGQRMAGQLAATFKIEGSRAVFAPRSGGTSSTGQALPTVNVTRGDNYIDADIEPIAGRPEHVKFKTKHYDKKAADWKVEEEDPDYDTDAEAEHTSRHAEPDQDSAKRKSKTHSKESERTRGTGTVHMQGEPTAQPEAPLALVGARDGVDGTYKISTVEHTYARGGGWTTSCDVVQPSGGAGKDTRTATAGAKETPLPPERPADVGSTSKPLGQGGIGHA